MEITKNLKRLLNKDGENNVELELKAKKSTIITLIALDEVKLNLVQRHVKLIGIFITVRFRCCFL